MLRGLQASFMRKWARHSTTPTARIQLFFLSDVSLACCLVSVARGAETSQHKWSLGQRVWCKPGWDRSS